jgi:DNA-binding helix-turn-helix protein|nr:MAG TPA: repressor protein [Bacteriophage sp.]
MIRGKDYLGELAIFRKRLSNALRTWKENNSHEELQRRMKYAKIKKRTLDEFINGKKIPTVLEILDISKYFELPLPELVDVRTAYAIIYERILIPKRVSDNISNYIIKTAITFSELAERTGIPERTIHRAGIRSRMRIKTLIACNDKIRALDSSLEDIQIRELEEVFRDVDIILEAKELLGPEVIYTIDREFGDEIKVLTGNLSLDSINYMKPMEVLNLYPIKGESTNNKNSSVDLANLDIDNPKDFAIIKDRVEKIKQSCDKDNVEDNVEHAPSKRYCENKVSTDTQRKLQEKCVAKDYITERKSNNANDLDEYEIGFRDGYFKALRDNGLLPERVK